MRGSENSIEGDSLDLMDEKEFSSRYELDFEDVSVDTPKDKIYSQPQSKKDILKDYTVTSCIAAGTNSLVFGPKPHVIVGTFSGIAVGTYITMKTDFVQKSAVSLADSCHKVKKILEEDRHFV